MKITFYLNSISPHQLPLARELVRRFGYGDVVYLHTDDFQQERAALGWSSAAQGVHVEKLTAANRHYLYDSELLYMGVRDLDVIAHRVGRGMKTLYNSERWFKPIDIGSRIGMPRLQLLLPGRLRMLVPGYRRMVKSFVGMATRSPCFRVLPIGPWAKSDFRAIGVPERAMADWAYFVEPSSDPVLHSQTGKRSDNALHVLYVGRLLALKRVDTVIRAVAAAATGGRPMACTIVGSGPEEAHLKKLANSVGHHSIFTFLPSVPISEVRPLMRRHDVVVFASNALDGWGAVVSEALSEGVPVVGTHETGASAAMLPPAQLFHSGDWRGLATRLRTVDFSKCFSRIDMSFTPSGAAEMMLNL